MSTTASPRVAIVTGAALGLGNAIALRLAQDGLHLVVNDLPKQSTALAALVKQIKDAGGNVVSFEGDATVEQTVQELVQVAVKEFGGLDVVSAGLLLLLPT
jgi:meso-butanediol dehydrogenase/(S,S)-butanediol dehydrogenase/diacetyl reductase